MWTVISSLASSVSVSWLKANWKLILVVVLAISFAGMVWAWQDARDGYRTATAQVGMLEEDLGVMADNLTRERAAAASARQASVDWAQEAADRGKDLEAAIEREVEANEAFAYCMSMRWADGVIDGLPK